MSALLTQLEHILAPWDAAESVSSSRAPHGGLSAGTQFQPPAPSTVGVPVSFLPTTLTTEGLPPSSATQTASATSLLDARQRTTKFELARTALAVFVSNSGEFRPVLQKTLAFVFQYTDFLLEERDRNVLELAAVRHLARQPNDAAGTASAANSAEDNRVASAHQRVRLVEAQMAALVEEASAQRDRYKAQIVAHEQQAAQLEALLVHQMELTEMLLHERDANSSGDGGGGGTGGDRQASPVGGGRGRAKAEALLSSAHDRAHANTSLWSDETWATRDRSYVQQLIARAEKEKLVADLETQVNDLKKERSKVQTKAQELLGLNARYARQAVELAARMSVIHDQNIALATDVQLFQRDSLREQQRAEKLLRDLIVSRRMLLTLLEVRAQEVQASSMAAFHPTPSLAAPQPTLNANTALLLHTAAAPAALGAAEAAAMARVHNDGASAALTGAAGGFNTVPSRATVATPTPTPTTTFTKPPTLEDKDLRAQLEALLVATADITMDGVDAAASTRTVADQQQMQRALEKMLLLRQETRRSEDHSTSAKGQVVCGATTVTGSGSVMPVLRLPPHLWASPHGCHRHVPRHLRTSGCCRLLALHPLVAESYVQELLAQRGDLRLSLRRHRLQEAEERAATDSMGAAAALKRRQNRWTLLAGDSGAGTGGGGGTTATATTATPTTASDAQAEHRPSTPPSTLLGRRGAAEDGTVWYMTPLDAYICLFVRVLWLNEEDIFLPYLPDDVKQFYLLEKAPTTERGPVAGAASSSSSSPGSPRGVHNPRERRPGGPLDGTAKPSHHPLTGAAPPLSPSEKQRRCLTLPLDAAMPEMLYTLPPEALRLTYALDVLSRSPESGFLTYAYGWASRGVLSELIFDVFQTERAVFLSMCRQVDVQRETLKASHRAEVRRRIREQRREERDVREAQRREAQAARVAHELEAADQAPPPPARAETAKKKAAGKKSKPVSAGATVTGKSKSPKTSKKPSTVPSANGEGDAPAPTMDASDEDVEEEDEDGASMGGSAAAHVDAGVDAPPSCAGCLPLVQLARILATMYPSYSLEKIEQLVVAAAAEGTDNTESPVLVYYGVLLPDRLLPGSAGAAGKTAMHTGADPSTASRKKPGRSVDPSEAPEAPASALLWRCGSFASLFFNHICDDALEAMSLVEDSLMSMAETLHPTAAGNTNGNVNKSTTRSASSVEKPARATAELSTDASSVPVEATEATEAQLSALGFTGLPLDQMQAWSAALRSVLHEWPRLRTRVKSVSGQPPRPSLSHDLGAEAAPRAQSQPTSHGPSPATRSLSTHSQELGPEPAAPSADAMMVVEVPRISLREVAAYLRTHTLLRRGPHKLSTATAAAISAGLPVESMQVVLKRESQLWNPSHAAYIHALQTRWHAVYGFVGARPGEADPAGPPPPTTSTAALAESVAAEVGSTDAATFFAWLQRRDPRREAVWGDDFVVSTSAILRPAEDLDDMDSGSEAITEDDDDDERPDCVDAQAAVSTSARGTVVRRRQPTPPPEPRAKSTMNREPS